MRMMTMVFVGMTLGSGCDRGSDDGDGRDNEAGLRSPGAPEAKKLSELTQGEQKNLCDWGDQLLLSNKVPSTEEACASVALDVSADEASCEMAAADCVEAGQDEDGSFCAKSPDGDFEACLEADDLEVDREERCAFDGCQATVAVYGACVRAYANAMAAVSIVPASCADAGKDDAGDDAGEAAFDAFFVACGRLAKQCPTDFEEDELEFDFSAGPAFEADRRAQLAHWLDTSALRQQAGLAFGAGK